jgi:hypothetical protein
MKNIHILPTDKPSRVYKNEISELGFLYEKSTNTDSFCVSYNIFITSSNSDINENDYIITKDVKLVQVSYLLSKDLEGASKVILTTDQDLINDGVQAIDDEFLEWFVKNPSFEEVEVNKMRYGYLNKFADAGYKIIIPKEETKLRLEKYSERFDNKDNELVEGIFNPENWGKRIVEEPK